MQRLARSKLLTSQQGTNGGYVLSRDPRTISALEVIRAIEGPLFITSCNSSTKACNQHTKCTVREPLQKVSRTIEDVLGRLTVWELREGTEDGVPHSRAAGGCGPASIEGELVRIEISGGNYGK